MTVSCVPLVSVGPSLHARGACSKAVQQYIAAVKNTVQNNGGRKGKVMTEEQKRAESRKAKVDKARADRELAMLMKAVAKDKGGSVSAPLLTRSNGHRPALDSHAR